MFLDETGRQNILNWMVAS